MDCIHCGQNVYTHGSACRIPPAIISRTMAPCHDCAAKDAEIAKLRAERDEVKRTLVSLFDDTKAEMKRLRADLDQARRDRNSAVECAEVLRGYVAEHKAALAAARAALDGERGACDAWRKAWKRYDETRTVPAYSLLEDAADNHDARRAALIKSVKP